MCAHPQGQEAAVAATSPPSRPSKLVQAGDRHGRSSASTGQDSSEASKSRHSGFHFGQRIVSGFVVRVLASAVRREAQHAFPWLRKKACSKQRSEREAWVTQPTPM